MGTLISCFTACSIILTPVWVKENNGWHTLGQDGQHYYVDGKIVPPFDIAKRAKNAAKIEWPARCRMDIDPTVKKNPQDWC